MQAQMNKYLLILIFVALTFASPAAAYLAYVTLGRRGIHLTDQVKN